MAERRGSPALTFAVLVAMLLALLGVAEGAARVKWTDAELTAIPAMPFLQDSPILLWKLRPNLDMRLPEGAPLRTNSDGMRTHARDAKAGRVRVLSLGESTTWGHGLPAEENYTERVATRLAADGYAVDVVNAGQPAWSLWQSWRFIETEGAAWEPDILVVYHLQNDIQSRGASNRADPFRVALTDRQLTDARAPFASISAVFARSRLQAALWKFVLAPRLSPARVGGTRDTVRVPDADRTVALDGLAAWCAAHGARLLLLHPVYGFPNVLHDAVLPRFASAHDIAFVHLQALATAEQAPHFFARDDTHPTAEGHAWIASKVAPALEEMLGPPPSAAP